MSSVPEIGAKNKDHHSDGEAEPTTSYGAILREMESKSWLLFQGESPGVYRSLLAMPDVDRYGGGLGRQYDSYDIARRDFTNYHNYGMIEFLNRKVTSPDGVDHCVLIEGYEPGVYRDRLSAFIIGLRWECGDIVSFQSSGAAWKFFVDNLKAGRVRTKEEHIVRDPKLMFPIKKYTWTVEEWKDDA
ncbi:hypothetical protein V5O48_003955 [Marasmius crinis-equi]|uniref:Uncharacterized protein n=1 Tax=Marasmius crinis-equi TaxID=585013 RepID=A0ABR3FRI9_9AGAR